MRICGQTASGNTSILGLEGRRENNGLATMPLGDHAVLWLNAQSSAADADCNNARCQADRGRVTLNPGTAVRTKLDSNHPPRSMQDRSMPTGDRLTRPDWMGFPTRPRSDHFCVLGGPVGAMKGFGPLESGWRNAKWCCIDVSISGLQREFGTFCLSAVAFFVGGLGAAADPMAWLARRAFGSRVRPKDLGKGKSAARALL